MAKDDRAARPSRREQDAVRLPIVGSARATPGVALYGIDFYTWTRQQAELLRARRFDDIDVKNIVEEIETLGRSERSSLRSAYRLIALHLLKLQHQPERKSRSWHATIVRERENVQHVLRDNPGLKPERDELFQSAYTSARKEAAAETGLALSTFPTTPPFDVNDVESDLFRVSDPETK